MLHGERTTKMETLKWFAIAVVALAVEVFIFGLVIFSLSHLWTAIFSGEAFSFNLSLFLSFLFSAFAGTIWYMKGKENV